MGNNFTKVKRILAIILLANLFVAILKIIIGALIKSTSMTADGFHSLADGSSNIVGLIGIQFASKPVDKDHPYGHGKFEMLAGLFIGIMLFMIGVKVFIDTIIGFVDPVLPEVTLESIFILLITLCINIFVCVYEYTEGKKLNSQILISDSMHTRSDIYISLGVLATLICIKYGLPPVIDSLASLVVVCFIMHAAYEIFADNCGILLDKAIVDTEKVKNVVLSFEQVKDAHNIRSRGYENDIHIDMHIITEPDLSIQQSHELIHNIEDKIRNDISSNIQVIAHIEPLDGETESEKEGSKGDDF